MSKTWRSILYVVGAFLVLCVFAVIMIIVVSQKEEGFLLFSIGEIEVGINSEIELKDISLQTNLPQDSIAFSSENEDIFIVSSGRIRPVGLGEGRLLAAASVKDKVYQNFVLVKVTSIPAGEEDSDFGVALCYEGSVYNLAAFNQNVNLYLSGGSDADRILAQRAGYYKSFSFEMPIGVEITYSGECVEVRQNVVTVLKAGECEVKVINRNIGKFKTLKVSVFEIPLTDFVLNCENSIELEIGQSMVVSVSELLPSFASDSFREVWFNIENSDIVRFDGNRFVAVAAGRTQLVFRSNGVEKTIEVKVAPNEWEISAKFLRFDGEGSAMIKVELSYCGLAVTKEGALFTRFVVNGIEQETLSGITCYHYPEASLGYYVYKVIGELPPEFEVKFYLAENSEVFALISL